MRRSWRIGIAALVVIALGAGGYLFLTGKRGLSRHPIEPRPIEVARLSAAETERLGWDPRGLDAVFAYAATLSTDTLMIVTDGEVVAAFGDLDKPYDVHSIRKAFLSALIGRHIGSGPRQIPFDATLEVLGINDAPGPLTPLQKQTTVLHLLKSSSGINHSAAAEEGLLAEKTRRLGTKENEPGTIWAYNNWDYNALTTIFETRTGLSIAEAFGAEIAAPIGMRDHTPDAIRYIEAPKLSQHKAAMFRMAARDLARFGELYLDKGIANGTRVLPESWIDHITADAVDTGLGGLRSAHGFLWWVPAADTGLPPGTFWAWGFGNQALVVIPAWRTVIVHQADMTAFVRRLLKLIQEDGVEGEAALEQLLVFCIDPANRKSEFCVQHRFIRPRDFAALMDLIVKAHR